jgi:adenosylcobinamide-phosphate guanylyltransferase
MKIPALIMAGGKGKRMELTTEKPLIPFLGRPLIDWVIDAVKAASTISEFYIVTSENTPETEKKCIEDGLKIIRTNASGYHNDLKQAVLQADLNGPVLTMPADLPAITGPAINKIVNAYERCGMEFLAVFAPIEKREALGLSVSSTDEYQGTWYAVTGVNIINGAKVTYEGKIDTAAIITSDIELLLNINTQKDLDISEKLMMQTEK